MEGICQTLLHHGCHRDPPMSNVKELFCDVSPQQWFLIDMKNNQIFKYCQPNGIKVVSQRGRDLHYLDHMIIKNLLAWKCVLIFWPFFYWVRFLMSLKSFLCVLDMCLHILPTINFSSEKPPTFSHLLIKCIILFNKPSDYNGS